MSPAVRIGIVYAAIFVGAGIYTPYMPVWLKAQGLNGAQIGLMFSAPMLGRLFIAPALAVWADGFRLRRTPIALFGVAGGLTYGSLLLVNGFGAWLAIWFVGTLLLGGMVPLLDVVTLRRRVIDGFSYGWPRGIGSAGFVAANVGFGLILARVPVDWVVIATASAGLVSGLAAGLFLPPEPVHDQGLAVIRGQRWRGLGNLLSNRPYLLGVGSAGLINASHAFYYAFASIIWQHQHIPNVVIGLLWGLGVAAEALFMWFMEGWRRKVGPERLILLGGVCGMIRWVAFAFTPPLWLLFPLQILHAASFCATFTGVLAWIERTAPRESASSAQTLSSSLSSGLFIGLATLGSGSLFDLVGPKGYLAMSLLALGGIFGSLMLPGQRRDLDVWLRSVRRRAMRVANVRSPGQDAR